MDIRKRKCVKKIPDFWAAGSWIVEIRPDPDCRWISGTSIPLNHLVFGPAKYCRLLFLFCAAKFIAISFIIPHLQLTTRLLSNFE
jgi:hypothetical protein